jgi:hypothetical protein
LPIFVRELAYFTVYFGATRNFCSQSARKVPIGPGIVKGLSCSTRAQTGGEKAANRNSCHRPD